MKLVICGDVSITEESSLFFDFGKEGLYDTIREIESEGLNYTGIGENYEDSRRNLIIEHPDVKIAVSNVDRSFN